MKLGQFVCTFDYFNVLPVCSNFWIYEGAGHMAFVFLLKQSWLFTSITFEVQEVTPFNKHI